MDDYRAWVLHITSWNQVDSVHFYGRVEHQGHERPAFHVERTLTAAQARELQRREREVARYRMFADDREEQARATYGEGDTTERFTDRDELIAAAIAAFMEVAEPGEALFTHMGWLRGDEPLATKEADNADA